MFQFLCQLFIAMTGNPLPEEVFENTLYHLLQGDRKGRKILVKSMDDFSSQTPHQLLISGWPLYYISATTQKGNPKIENIISNKRFICLNDTFVRKCRRFLAKS